MAGSAWAWGRHRTGGTLPPLDLVSHTRVAGLLRGLVTDGVATAVHDIASGGLGLCLAEMAVSSGVGFEVQGVPSAAHLFSEAPSRAVLTAPIAQVELVCRAAEQAGVPAVVLGRAGGDRLVVDGLVDLTLAEATEAWWSKLPAALGTGATQG